MAHPFDVDQLVAAILGDLNALLDKDIGEYVAFAKTQTKALAKQAAWIAEAAVKGEIDEDERTFFLKDLARLAENFAKVVVGLTLLTIEKAWNAIAGRIWQALSAALKVALPLPAVPTL